MKDIESRPSTTTLELHDLVASVAQCTSSDPGPDPTWYPDDWPTEPEQEESDAQH